MNGLSKVSTAPAFIFTDLSGLMKVWWLRSADFIYICKIQPPIQSGRTLWYALDIMTPALQMFLLTHCGAKLWSGCPWVTVRATYINGGLGVLQDTIVQNKETLQKTKTQWKYFGHITAKTSIKYKWEKEGRNAWKWKLPSSCSTWWHSDLFNIQRATLMDLKEKKLLFKSWILPCASPSEAISSFST